MSFHARSCNLVLLTICVVAVAGLAQAADPSAPARDNVPRIWKALAGDHVVLDGQEFALRGVACPAPDSEKGRQAKALLNTFLLGSRYSPVISCTTYIEGGVKAVDCDRRGQMASAVMLGSGLCHALEGGNVTTSAEQRVSLARYVSAHRPIGTWRLRSCLGVHPDQAPLQCRLASRTWPLRYAETVRRLERPQASSCLTDLRPARSAILPQAAKTPPNRYSVLPFLPKAVTCLRDNRVLPGKFRIK